jgi:hypothetical protein
LLEINGLLNSFGKVLVRVTVDDAIALVYTPIFLHASLRISNEAQRVAATVALGNLKSDIRCA